MNDPREPRKGSPQRTRRGLPVLRRVLATLATRLRGLLAAEDPSEAVDVVRREDQVTVFWMLGLNVSIVALVSLIVYVSWSFTGRRTSEPAHVPDLPISCPDGYYRSDSDNECYKIQLPPTQCQRHESCEDCPCGPGLRCDDTDKKCVDEDPARAICDQPEVVTLLNEIEAHYGECLKASGNKTASSCSLMQMDLFQLKNENVIEVLERFPNSVSVHFPSGKPDTKYDLANDPWFEERREKLKKDLASSVPGFKQASLVIVLGRASKAKGHVEIDQNSRLTQLRMQAFRTLVGPEIGNDKKLREFALNDGYELTIARFQQLNNLVIAAEEGDAEALRGFLEAIKEGKALSPGELRDAQQKINQSILVIPIQCPLDSVTQAISR